MSKRKRDCPNGHRYRKGSFRIDANGRRQCLRCLKARTRRNVQAYRERRYEAGLCRYGGCDAARRRGLVFCEEHGPRHAH